MSPQNGVKNRRDSHGSFLVVSFTASVTVWLLFALPNKQTPCKVMCRFTKRAKRVSVSRVTPISIPIHQIKSSSKRSSKEMLRRGLLGPCLRVFEKGRGGEGNAEWKNLKRRAVSFG